MKTGKRHHYNRLNTGNVEGEDCYYDLPTALRRLINETLPQLTGTIGYDRESLAKLVIRAIHTDRKKSRGIESC